MIMRKIFFLFPLAAFAVAALTLSSCKKEFDMPPANEIPVGSILTIADLKNMHTGTDVYFTQDYSVYATVTADEVSGNLYKNVFVADATGAIDLHLINSGGLYEGDYIRIALKGTKLTEYNGLLQIDSVDVDVHVIKQSTNNPVTPTVTTIDMISSSTQSQLIRLDNVQFIAADTAATYADAIGQISANRYLKDCVGNQIIVRTSGFANFAGSAVPNGSGSVIAIVGIYNSDIQLYIRKLSDVSLSQPRCPEPYLDKDFDDLSVTSGGWTTQQVVGTDNWQASSFGPDIFARISNYNGTNNTQCEAWMISPAVNLSSATAPELTFRTACNYSGAQMEVYVSTNYTGGAPSSATWTQLNPALSTGTWTWVNSGAINLSAYLTTNVRIAFRYLGSNSDGKTWEVDDVLIDEP
jgi:hypothetical protein